QINVAGSVVAQNAVTLSGGCALYAHTRLDAASGTYSDLGNASVYADGQTWVGGGGSCAAGANTGSTNAICADGSELSGHVTPTCGTTSAFLSAGDAAINPNPCAAGIARPSVPPLSATLPPEPNTDAVAISTLPGSVACNPGATYPNLVVNGTTVGTAEVGTTAPTKDAAGYYHFKPSCYGYLNIASLSGGISNVQVGPEVGPTPASVTPTMPAASQAGTLLVVDLESDTSPSNKPFTAPAGWVSANNAFLDGTA